jgi:hypothetical protein
MNENTNLQCADGMNKKKDTEPVGLERHGPVALGSVRPELCSPGKATGPQDHETIGQLDHGSLCSRHHNSASVACHSMIIITHENKNCLGS